jgi:hypothetical protein
MAIGYHGGRREESPGKLMFRYKGEFSHLEDARKLQQKLSKEGKKAKVVTRTDGYSVYVMAYHDFWGRDFIYKWR